MLVCILLYLAEKQMLWSTLGLALLSLLGFSLEESNGIYTRSGLFTAIFFAQFIAYGSYRLGWLHDIRRNRFHFSIQVLAAGYVLAGISKLMDTGISWPLDAPLMSIQIMKSYFSVYTNRIDSSVLDQGWENARYVMNNKEWITVMMAGALLLELGAFIMLINKRVGRIYGILLLGMHIGIHVIMHITIGHIVLPMTILLINPLYLGWVVLKKALGRLAFIKG